MRIKELDEAPSLADISGTIKRAASSAVSSAAGKVSPTVKKQTAQIEKLYNDLILTWKSFVGGNFGTKPNPKDPKALVQFLSALGLNPGQVQKAIQDGSGKKVSQPNNRIAFAGESINEAIVPMSVKNILHAAATIAVKSGTSLTGSRLNFSTTKSTAKTNGATKSAANTQDSGSLHLLKVLGTKIYRAIGQSSPEALALLAKELEDGKVNIASSKQIIQQKPQDPMHLLAAIGFEYLMSKGIKPGFAESEITETTTAGGTCAGNVANAVNALGAGDPKSSIYYSAKKKKSKPVILRRP
jgi:hypothetical protein